MSRIVEVYSALNAIEAHFLVSLLSEHDIEARVVGESLAGGAGELPLGAASAPRIWVHETQAVRAKEVLLQWEDDRRERRERESEAAD